MYLLKWKEKNWLIIRQSEIACNTMEKSRKSCPAVKVLVRSILSDSVRVEVGCSAVKTGIMRLGLHCFRFRPFPLRGAYQLFDSVARLL